MRLPPAAQYHQARAAAGEGGGLPSLAATLATVSTAAILKLLHHDGHLRHQARAAWLPGAVFREQHSYLLTPQIN